MNIRSFWILMAVISATYGGPATLNLNNAINNNSAEDDTTINSLAKCSYSGGLTGMINCAAAKTLRLLQNAASSESVELLPGVVLFSENSQNQRQGKSITDEKLPENPKQRVEKLLNLILTAASRFFSGRTLKIQIPEVSPTSIARAIEEGRGKLKQKLNPLMLGIGVKVIILKALLILALGFIALKALLISKVALVLAVIGAVQTLFNGGLGLKNIGGGSPYGWISAWGGGSGYGPSYGTSNYYPGWTTNNIGGGWGNSQYPYARSIDDASDLTEETKTSSQDLAYSKQKPQ